MSEKGVSAAYKDVHEASAAWGVSERQVQLLCKGGAVPGAVRFGRSWAIPKGTPKPADRRRKAGKGDATAREADGVRETGDACERSASRAAHVSRGNAPKAAATHIIEKPDAGSAPHAASKAQASLRRCPNLLMTDLFTKPGAARKTAEALPEAGGERSLALGWLRYLQGDVQTALELAMQKHRRTKAQSKDAASALAAGRGLLTSVCAMYAGDAGLWEEAHRMVENATADACKQGGRHAGRRASDHADSAASGAGNSTAPTASERDFWIAAMDSALFDCAGFSERFARGDFSGLPADSIPSARFFFTKLLLSKGCDLESGDERQREADLDACALVAETFISQTRVEGVYIADLYLHLAAAIAYKLRDAAELAEAHIDAAIDLAAPDGLISPLAEYAGRLDLALYRRLRERKPAMCRRTVELAKRLGQGWVPLHNELLGRQTEISLTPREREVGRMALAMSDRRIAGALGIGEATVKRTLANARRKTGAHTRADLARFL